MNPVMPSSFLAAATAFIQASSLLPLYFLRNISDLIFETTLPRLFFMIWLWRSPPLVFSLAPLNTRALASFPAAILLFFVAFFIDAFFIADFMTIFIAAFIATFFIIGNIFLERRRCHL